MGQAKAAADSVTEAERLMIDAAEAEHRGQLAEAREIRSELARRYPEDARLRYELGLSYWSTDPAAAAPSATDLYNSESSRDIVHAGRSIVWLKPDHIFIYDRATSQTAGRFKRFWLNLPTQATISGNRATMTMPSGQQLFITALLPADAVITPKTIEPEALLDVAEEEPMHFRLRVEAPAGPQDVRFLHVLQGADSGVGANPVSLVQSTSGTPFDGTLADSTLLLFPVNPDTPFSSLTYTVPANTAKHLITGLTPKGSYDLATQTVGDDIRVTVNPGTTSNADSGGILIYHKTSGSGGTGGGESGSGGDSTTGGGESGSGGDSGTGGNGEEGGRALRREIQ